MVETRIMCAILLDTKVRKLSLAPASLRKYLAPPLRRRFACPRAHRGGTLKRLQPQKTAVEHAW